MNFIPLTGYYPEEHAVYLEPRAVVAFSRNVTNPRSKGSTVYVAGVPTPFQVLETSDAISELLGIVEDKRSAVLEEKRG